MTFLQAAAAVGAGAAVWVWSVLSCLSRRKAHPKIIGHMTMQRSVEGLLASMDASDTPLGGKVLHLAREPHAPIGFRRRQ